RASGRRARALAQACGARFARPAGTRFRTRRRPHQEGRMHDQERSQGRRSSWRGAPGTAVTSMAALALAAALGCGGGGDSAGSADTTGTTAAPASPAPAGPLTEADITPQLVALGDSIFKGQAAGGICFTCHGQN